MKKIDEQGYKDGGSAFNKGRTLRWLAEQKIASVKAQGEGWQDREDYQMSLELGFADALLNRLRNVR